VSNSQKSKEELEAEVVALRRKVVELEARLATFNSPANGCPVERSSRLPLEADVEFMGDFDVLRATGVNISEGGICFEVRDELPFEMRFDLHGVTHLKRAHCVWLRRLPSGGYHLGLRFVPPKPGPEF